MLITYAGPLLDEGCPYPPKWSGSLSVFPDRCGDPRLFCFHPSFNLWLMNQEFSNWVSQGLKSIETLQDLL